jgi:ABC-type transport system involved in multi-copper enzyme maturation permease subunit
VVASYVSAYKYNLDITVQALFVGSVVLGFVLYILIIFSWVVELIPRHYTLIVGICNLVYLLGLGLWAGLGYEILVSSTHTKLLGFYIFRLLVLLFVWLMRLWSWLRSSASGEPATGGKLKYLFIAARIALLVDGRDAKMTKNFIDRLWLRDQFFFLLTAEKGRSSEDQLLPGTKTGQTRSDSAADPIEFCEHRIRLF